MRYLLAGLFIGVIGCTAPSQKIALRATDDVYVQGEKLFRDYDEKLGQAYLDLMSIEIEAAIEAGDTSVAKELASEIDHRSQNLSYLREQWNRLLFGKLSVARMYVLSQQGAVDLIYADIKEARAAEKAAQASQ